MYLPARKTGRNHRINMNWPDNRGPFRNNFPNNRTDKSKARRFDMSRCFDTLLLGRCLLCKYTRTPPTMFEWIIYKYRWWLDPRPKPPRPHRAGNLLRLNTRIYGMTAGYRFRTDDRCNSFGRFPPDNGFLYCLRMFCTCRPWRGKKSGCNPPNKKSIPRRCRLPACTFRCLYTS